MVQRLQLGIDMLNVTKGECMFGMISLQASGERIEHVGQKPAFFALTYNGIVVEYFTSVEALKFAVASLEVRINELVETAWDIQVETVSDIRIAA
jgi:hypothetical protein